MILSIIACLSKTMPLKDKNDSLRSYLTLKVPTKNTNNENNFD